jgi:hypothetical protein
MQGMQGKTDQQRPHCVSVWAVLVPVGFLQKPGRHQHYPHTHTHTTRASCWSPSGPYRGVAVTVVAQYEDSSDGYGGWYDEGGMGISVR